MAVTVWYIKISKLEFPLTFNDELHVILLWYTDGPLTLNEFIDYE